VLVYLLDGGVVTSASDLTEASKCEFAFLREVDAKLGRIQTLEEVSDPVLERTALLGDVHEHRVLEGYRGRFGAGVVEINRPNLRDPGALEAALQATATAFRDGVDVVFQATFFNDGFVGFADFIVRTAEGSYQVQDTKLARSAKVTALLQLAAYCEQLERIGVSVADTVQLLLGDGKVSEHRLRDVLPVYRKRRARLREIIAERLLGTEAVRWGDERYSACGHCAACEQQIELHRDVLLVANMRLSQRVKLHEAGIATIEQLAAAGPVPGMSSATFSSLQQQARPQITPPPPDRAFAWEVIDPAAFAALSEPDAGDIFFDFEGDPLHEEDGQWGLDYLFGLVDGSGDFTSFWAHSLADERKALIAFLAYVRERREQYPGMHIYHYAPYERTHLLSLAARHGVGEEEVDDLLRSHVLVDLLSVVRRALRIGSKNYKLKTIEALYMNDDQREGVATAADSMVEYARSQDLLATGEAEAAAAVLADIGRYNAYDCRSTLALRDWLLARAAGADTLLAVRPEPEYVTRDPDPVYLELTALVAGVPPIERTADQTALALASAAIDYHRREDKRFWQDHFSRLSSPVDEWDDTRNVVISERVEILRDWYREGLQRKDRRRLRLNGAIAPGSNLSTGDSPYLVYDPPFPFLPPRRDPGARVSHSSSTIVEIIDETTIIIDELLPNGVEHYTELPMALTPKPPIDAGTRPGAISEWGRSVLDALPTMLPNASLDVLRREPPRVEQLVPVTEETSDAIRDTLLLLDRSYLAVQGPPGTGKTYTGSRVIASLVRDHGWKVGVVAQSHETVGTMLKEILAAGLPAGLVGKKPKLGTETVPVPWTSLDSRSAGTFVTQPGGIVIGGTAWTFSNAAQVPRDSLDLLVIDEAGQFSLAGMIASGVSAKRLLLLGDPQQLPQVSQGSHPEPVDVSALGWLSAGHDVLPTEFGYFLAHTRRMHPDLTEPVSDLSYDGKLNSIATDRSLDGIEAGLCPVPVEHSGNSTSSIEEADAVVTLVADLLDREWIDGSVTRPLTQTDIIVVAPYNAQVELLHLRLAASGFHDVPVGTVDRFQGKEAVIALVSLAASAAAEVPRGLEFLLLANRLNVAISRAQWASYLLYSPELTEYLPNSVAGLAQMSAFITLIDRPTRTQST
jgi:predicted RecB family nuclease